MKEDLIKAMEILMRCISHLEECDNLEIGDEVHILRNDILIYSDKVTKDNIKEIKRYICDGHKYFITNK